MKKMLLVLMVIGFVAGCSAMKPKECVKGDNSLEFESSGLHLKIGDDFIYEDKRSDLSRGMKGITVQEESWLWLSADRQKGINIIIYLLPDHKTEFIGSVNAGWKRDHEYHQSFPKTVHWGGKNWYVDVIRKGTVEKAIFGRQAGHTKLIYICYLETKQDNLNWQAFLERAYSSVQFLPQ